jgi:hypothetical protein
LISVVLFMIIAYRDKVVGVFVPIFHCALRQVRFATSVAIK